jgi:hypothetical protein
MYSKDEGFRELGNYLRVQVYHLGENPEKSLRITLD